MTSIPPTSSMTPLTNSPSAQLPSPRPFRVSPYQWPIPVTPPRLYPVTPTTGTINTSDWSVKDIIDMYKDDPESLKTVLTAKAEEDKRRAAEEAFKAEQLRLQWKQVELEIIREQNRNGVAVPNGRYNSGSGAPTPTNTQPPPNPFRVSSPENPNNGGNNNYMAPSPSSLIPPEIIHTAPPISPTTVPTYANIYHPMQYVQGPQAQVDYAPHTTITLNQPTIPNRGTSSSSSSSSSSSPSSSLQQLQLQQQHHQKQQQHQQQQQQQQQHNQQRQQQHQQNQQHQQYQQHQHKHQQHHHHQQQQPVPLSHPHAMVQSYHTYYQPHQTDYHPQASPSYGYSPGGYGALTPTSANTARQIALPIVTSAPQHLHLPPTPSLGYPASPSEYGTLSPMSAASPRSPNTTGHKRKRNSSSSHHGFIGDKIDRSTSPSESKVKKENEDEDAPKLTHDQIMEAVRAKVMRGVAVGNAADKSTTEDTEKPTPNGSNRSLSPSPRIKRSPSVASPLAFPAEDHANSSTRCSPALTATTQSPRLSAKSPLISPSAANVMLSPRVGVNAVDGAEE